MTNEQVWSSPQEGGRQTDAFYETHWKERGLGWRRSPARRRRVILFRWFLAHYIKGVDRGRLRVLDYGCGNGWFIQVMRDLGFVKVEGYDVTRSVIEGNRRRDGTRGTQYWLGNGSLPSPMPTEAYDLITSIEVIEHVRYSEQEAVVSDMARILKRGGWLFLTTPNGKLRRWALRSELGQPVEDWITPRRLLRVAESAGLACVRRGSRGIERYGPINSLLMNYRLKRLVSTLELDRPYRRAVEALDRGITTWYVFRKVGGCGSKR